MKKPGTASRRSPLPKRGGEERYTVAQVAEALKLNHGNASATARVLGCHPDTVRNYCERYPEVQAARTSGCEVRLDLAEAALDRAVEQCEGWAVCFLLKTQGKRRGYIERAENVTINFDVSKLSDEQLNEIVAGKDPVAVLASAAGRG